jgi:hypothetical protein
MRTWPVIFGLLLSWTIAVTAAEPASFNRDVRPILSDKCFRCHGPDETARKAKLRLDQPGEDLGRDLIERITHADADERMPPPETGQQLTDREIKTLRQWVRQGAHYEKHWSLSPPTRPPLPASSHPRIRNAVDAFVLNQLKQEGLNFSRPASREMLIRRLSLALTGLPPTINEIDAFLRDRNAGALKRLVDRLLRSPPYGERMAGPWLDAARYADTNGYFTDNERTMWPWRDWVIRAFNDNMPFDQFTIEQLAGDLLPKATLQQKIATGFNRNHMVNNESGLIPEEFRVEYVADRVKTTSTVWMGLTLECARCHDHKYDPITQRDYYRFFSFFNNVPEKGLDGSRGNAAPVLNVATPTQKAAVAKLEQRVKQAEQMFKPIDTAIATAQEAWEQTALARLTPVTKTGLVGHYPLEGGADTKATFPAGILGKGASYKGGEVIEIDRPSDIRADRPFTIAVWIKPSAAGCLISKMDEANRMRGFDLVYRKNKILVHLVNKWTENDIGVRTVTDVPSRQWNHLTVTYDGSHSAAGIHLYLNGVHQPLTIDRDSLSGTITNDEPLRIGRREASASYKGMIDDIRIYDRALNATDAERLATTQFLRGALAMPGGKRDRGIRQRLRKHFIARRATAVQRQADAEMVWLRKELSTLKSTLPVMMVMAESKQPRQAYLLERGEYNKPKEKLFSDVPSSLKVRLSTAPPNRLELARWLMQSDNSLTARVFVNRIWAQFFGRGIVATPEDFGTQGEWPTHPELLDWLACEFRDSGWDVKQLIRLIVTSTTYRQTSHASADLIGRDPDNRLLARGPRIRLDAETLRDNALAASGLLVNHLGGPSVKPYQPPGLWRDMTYDGQLAYKPDLGASLYRRSLYTYWKRQAPPPNMLIFDAPTRDTCSVVRPRTNTPLQALALMNDPTFVEAARHLASRMIREPEALRFGFRSTLARSPNAEELGTLNGIYEWQLASFRAQPDSAKSLAGSPELAALTVVASVILSLDETINQP